MLSKIPDVVLVVVQLITVMIAIFELVDRSVLSMVGVVIAAHDREFEPLTGDQRAHDTHEIVGEGLLRGF